VIESSDNGRWAWHPTGEHIETLLGSPRTAVALERMSGALPSVITTTDPGLRAVSLYLLARGSKRIRPALLFLAAEHGVFDESLLSPVAMALELIHTASLYHDDVMDRAAVRRGGPSANAEWGNQAATIAGIYLLGRANALLLATRPELVTTATEAAAELCIGQLQEVEHAYDLDLTEDQHLAIIARKTATLFELPCRLGAQLGGLATPKVTALASYGHHLGIAFQLADDALDLAGQQSHLGKDITNDLREGTYSLAVLHTLAHPEHGPPLAAVLSRVHLDSADIDTAINLIRARGGIQHAMDTAHQHAAHARAALQALPAGPARTTLTRLTDYVVTRPA
jgi:heptaprenyl diphosphate synthase